MPRIIPSAVAAGLLFAAPALAYESVSTRTTTTTQDTPNYTATVREETTAPVVGAPNVSKQVTVRQSGPAGTRTVTEKTDSTSGVAFSAPHKPATTQKTSVVSQADEDGNYRRVETRQTLNDDGYMVREEYRERRD